MEIDCEIKKLYLLIIILLKKIYGEKKSKLKKKLNKIFYFYNILFYLYNTYTMIVLYDYYVKI